MKKFDDKYVNDLFIDIFTEVVNNVDEKLNEKLTEMHNFDFPLEYYRNGNGELDVYYAPEISCSRFENTQVRFIKYEIKQIEDGIFIISGEADVKYNLTALKCVYYPSGYNDETGMSWNSEVEEYELTDGYDTDEAEISFDITVGCNLDYEGNEVFSEYDFELDVY